MAKTPGSKHLVLTFMVTVSVITVAFTGCGGGSSSGPGGEDTGNYCSPDCADRFCGDDGCGGSCGECSGNTACDSSGSCVASCQPNCSGKHCGDDGCDGTCGSCDDGFKCSSGNCVLDGTSIWTLTLTSGTVTEEDQNGEAWDVPGGMPDPFVCVTINGQDECSNAEQDTISPTWNYSFDSTTANALQSGIIVGIYDEDLSDNDTICSQGTIAVKDEYFTSGIFQAACDYATVHFKLAVKGGSSSCVGKSVGASCANGYCLSVTGGGLECVAKCTTVGSTCQGGFCYAAEYGNICLASGSKTVGDTCNALNDCAGGYPCLSNTCYQVCSNDVDCTIQGETCWVVEGATFKVCSP